MPGNRGGTLLKHRSTGKCLNAHYVSGGAEINVWPCDANDPDQNWNLDSVSNGRILIKRTGTNLCVDTPTRDNAGKVILWGCDGNNPNQRWLSSAVPSSAGYRSNSDGLVVLCHLPLVIALILNQYSETSLVTQLIPRVKIGVKKLLLRCGIVLVVKAHNSLADIWNSTKVINGKLKCQQMCMVFTKI
jgi:hypothetical protein